MKKIIKDYWDIILGALTGYAAAALVRFKLEKVQLIYSIIILILVSIGVFKIIKQSIDKKKEKRPRKNVHTFIDSIVDAQKPVKAINLAQSPTKDGERLGSLLIETYRGGKRAMKKVKVFFDKYKGYLLTIALAILTIMEDYGGFLNDAFGGKLVIGGYEILPLITLGATIVVGLISNGYNKEEREKIKALFSKHSSNELVIAEIKKTIKEDEAKLKEFNKLLAVQETALENCETTLANAKNTLAAKKEMRNMVPQLATDEDVILATNNVVSCEAAVNEKKNEIAQTNATIKNLTTKITALRNQL